MSKIIIRGPKDFIRHYKRHKRTSEMKSYSFSLKKIKNYTEILFIIIRSSGFTIPNPHYSYLQSSLSSENFLIFNILFLYYASSHFFGSGSFYSLTPLYMGKLLYRWLIFFGIEPVIFFRKVTGRNRRKLLRKYR